MATDQAGNAGKANEGPPPAAAVPSPTGAPAPTSLRGPAPPIAAASKRDALAPIACAALSAEVRGPKAPAVAAPLTPKSAVLAGAVPSARAHWPAAAAREPKRGLPVPAIVSMSALSPPSPLGPAIIAAPLMTRGPLVFRTKKDQAIQAPIRPPVSPGPAHGPNEGAPLMPPAGQQARGNHLPPVSASPFLRPMTIGPGGTPELVAFPPGWRCPQARAQPEAALAAQDAQAAPEQKVLYPLMELADNDDSLTSRPSTPQEAPPEREDEQCGFFWFRPPFLRVFRTPAWVLLSLCSIEFTQSFVSSGVLSVVLPTIERRFNLSSLETGMILSAFNVINSLFIVPVAFLGSTRHKPVIISSGMAIMAAGSFMFFLAYALAPSYVYGAEMPDLCYATPPPLNQTVDTCGEQSIRDFRFLLILGSMLQGAGVTPLHTLGMSFLDENLPVRLTSLFIGTYSAMAVLGPAFGFLVAGYFLSVFVDLKDVSQLGLTSQSSVWIGAWWVGFLVAAIMGGIVSIPMATFPKHLPSYQHCQMVRRLYSNKGYTEQDSTYGQYMNELPRSILSLLKNIPFVMMTLASVTEAMVGTAVAAFSVKFFEAEFAMTPSRTAAALGSILIPAGVGGTLMGGALVSKLDMTIRAMLKLCCVTSVIPWLCMWTFMLHCPNPHFFHGETWSSNRSVAFTSECNENCHCGTQLLDPICSVENVIYASPCFAGCAEKEIVPNPEDENWELQVYKNCSCVPTPPGAPMNETVYDFDATRLKCSTNCNLLVTYMVFIFICVFFSFFCAAPSITIMMRCVEEKERAVGLAVKCVSVRLFGNIPAPLVLGSVIDHSCVMWQEMCNERGACLLYNNKFLALSMLEFLVPVKTGSIILFGAALVKLRNLEE
ncbi:solute carrier organic anion transporter family member 4A1-like isoform X1 [Dermacentor albipictus]|uniref:solute carrier organic anion transporter family member 4A1-like isoform X1 n=1 Tax=Dermacentor albipictus TaxID=60249 RepID=UPI0031FC6B34